MIFKQLKCCSVKIPAMLPLGEKVHEKCLGSGSQEQQLQRIPRFPPNLSVEFTTGTAQGAHSESSQGCGSSWRSQPDGTVL